MHNSQSIHLNWVISSHKVGSASDLAIFKVDEADPNLY